MNNKAWFYNSAFKEFCKTRGLEPQLNDIGDRLVLICPKVPEQPLQDEIAKELTEFVPGEVEWGFSPGLSEGTRRVLGAYLKANGVPDAVEASGPLGTMRMPNKALAYGDDGDVTLIFLALPKVTALQPGSPVWREIGHLLQKDPYTKTWQIVVGQDVYRNSEGYEKPDEDPNEGMDMNSEDTSREMPLIPQTPIVRANAGEKFPKINDNRFDRDRDPLPKDNMDLKILLESCGSVEEFLKNI